jgi:hypothetical protein
MSWKNPNVLADYITTMDNRLYMYPFDLLDDVELAVKTNGGSKTPMYYQWMQTGFGQSLLIKRRDDKAIKVAVQTNVQILHSQTNLKLPLEALAQSSLSRLDNKEVTHMVQPELPSVASAPSKTCMSIDELTNIAIKNNFNRELIGQHIVELAESPLGCNGVIAYSAIISKAVVARKAKV